MSSFEEMALDAMNRKYRAPEPSAFAVAYFPDAKERILCERTTIAELESFVPEWVKKMGWASYITRIEYTTTPPAELLHNYRTSIDTGAL